MAYRYILESDTPIRLTADLSPVVVVPPVVVPPVVVIPPVPVQPFRWPADPGPATPMQYWERAMGRWSIPGRPEDDPQATMYATLPEVGRPTSALRNAGIILRPSRLAGYRLWAPPNAPDDMLWAIIEGRL